MQLPPQPPLDGSVSVLPGLLDWLAEHSADNPAFVYPDPDPALATCAATSYKQFADATHRIARILRPVPAPDRAVVAMFVHTDTLLFHAVLVAIVRAGLVPFPMSPRNSPQAVASMLERTACHRIISQPAFAPVMDGVRAALPAGFALAVDPLPALADVFPAFAPPSAAPAAPVVPYPPAPQHVARSDLVLYLHSSGSTGFPKPIPHTDITILGWCKNACLAEGRARGLRWAAAPLPPFHTMGIDMHLYASLTSGLPVSLYAPRSHLGHAPPMPTPANMLENARHTRVNAVVTIPAFLEVWAQSEEDTAYLASQKIVTFAGGPLSTVNGDRLAAAGVHLAAIYGGTEFGAPTSIFDRDIDPPMAHTDPDHYAGGKTQADWAWMQFPKQVSIRWVPQGEKMYECIYMTCATHQPSVENLPGDEKGYATSDLFEQHPTKPNLWRIVGRTDDVIVLSTGEKIVPIPQEGHIGAHPAVAGVVMFGRGRLQPGILVEPRVAVAPGDESKMVELRNLIWKQVEEANVAAPAFARLFKEMILVSDPARPFPRAGKGTVIRKQALALYEEDIAALYKTVEESTDAQGIAPPVAWTEENVQTWLSQHAAAILGNGLPSLTEDLFEQGFDSLGATFLRNRIIGALRSSADAAAHIAARAVQPNFVFAHSTLAALAGALVGLIHGGGVSSSDAASALVADIDGLIAQYSAQLSPAPLRERSDGGAIVLITGTTGSLGAHVLATLLGDDRVQRVYALNRGQELPDRQRTVFAEARLPVALLDDPKLVLLSGDILRADLGLQPAVLEEIRASATAVVHAAWRVNFNLALRSFEGHIDAAIRLAAVVPGARFVFASSTTAAQAWPAAAGHVPEAPLHDATRALGVGYGMAKFVVEEVLAARAAATATTLRIGQIAGPRASGVWNTAEWVPILVKSSIALGAFPEFGGMVSWVPMDAVARATADVALARDAPVLVNITHPRPVPYAAAVGAIRAALARDVPSEPAGSWLARLEHAAAGATAADMERIPAIKLLEFFRGLAAQDVRAEGVEVGGIALFETAEAQRVSPALRSLPTLDKSDAQAWVKYWQEKKFIV